MIDLIGRNVKNPKKNPKTARTYVWMPWKIRQQVQDKHFLLNNYQTFHFPELGNVIYKIFWPSVRKIVLVIAKNFYKYKAKEILTVDLNSGRFDILEQ